MLRNYFKIAFRNIIHNKIYSTINIFGLALGIACCLLLTLYIQDEISYDKHHDRVDDLYRIVTNFQSDVGFNKQGSVSPPIAMTLKDEVPEIEAAVRVLNPIGVSQSLIRYQENLF
jgi:putative ABC transport system permease protein